MRPTRGQSGGLPIVEADVVQGGCGVSGAALRSRMKTARAAGIAASAAVERTSPPTLTGVPVLHGELSLKAFPISENRGYGQGSSLVFEIVERSPLQGCHLQLQFHPSFLHGRHN